MEEVSGAPSDIPYAVPISSEEVSAATRPEAPLNRSVFVFPGRSMRGDDQYAIAALKNISSMDKGTVAEAKQFLSAEQMSARENHPILKVHIGEKDVLGFTLDQSGKQCNFEFRQELKGPLLDGTITIEKGQLIYQAHGAKYISAVARESELVDAGQGIKCALEGASPEFTFTTIHISSDMAFDVATSDLGSGNPGGAQCSDVEFANFVKPYGLEYIKPTGFWCSLGNFDRRFYVRGRLALPQDPTTESMAGRRVRAVFMTSASQLVRSGVGFKVKVPLSDASSKTETASLVMRAAQLDLLNKIHVEVALAKGSD
jgi:hypothetical protein